MDKLEKYRKIICKILTKQASYKSSIGEIDDYAVCDEKTDNYILLNVGWYNKKRRQHGFPIHIRIKDSKVWVEWDGTDQEIVQQLIDNGIPPEDIVLGFQQEQTHLEKELIAA